MPDWSAILGDAIRGGIVGASTPNIGEGGGIDMMNAARASMDYMQQQELLRQELRRQEEERRRQMEEAAQTARLRKAQEDRMRYQAETDRMARDLQAHEFGKRNENLGKNDVIEYQKKMKEYYLSVGDSEQEATRKSREDAERKFRPAQPNNQGGDGPTPGQVLEGVKGGYLGSRIAVPQSRVLPPLEPQENTPGWPFATVLNEGTPPPEPGEFAVPWAQGMRFRVQEPPQSEAGAFPRTEEAYLVAILRDETATQEEKDAAQARLNQINAKSTSGTTSSDRTREAEGRVKSEAGRYIALAWQNNPTAPVLQRYLRSQERASGDGKAAVAAYIGTIIQNRSATESRMDDGGGGGVLNTPFLGGGASVPAVTAQPADPLGILQ